MMTRGEEGRGARQTVDSKVFRFLAGWGVEGRGGNSKLQLVGSAEEFVPISRRRGSARAVGETEPRGGGGRQGLGHACEKSNLDDLRNCPTGKRHAWHTRNTLKMHLGVGLATHTKRIGDAVLLRFSSAMGPRYVSNAFRRHVRYTFNALYVRAMKHI